MGFVSCFYAETKTFELLIGERTLVLCFVERSKGVS
jgi:hypothetical protein